MGQRALSVLTTATSIHFSLSFLFFFLLPYRWGNWHGTGFICQMSIPSAFPALTSERAGCSETPKATGIPCVSLLQRNLGCYTALNIYWFQILEQKNLRSSRVLHLLEPFLTMRSLRPREAFDPKISTMPQWIARVLCFRNERGPLLKDYYEFQADKNIVWNKIYNPCELLLSEVNLLDFDYVLSREGRGKFPDK